MADKRVFHFDAKIEDCEIRGIKDVSITFTDKKGQMVESHHIELKCDCGEDCERIYLIDKNMDNLSVYKKGQVGVFTIRVDAEQEFGTKCKISVISFEEK